jgi:hypothetical protein
LGQWWAFHSCLGAIADLQKMVIALRSLSKYNYDPDIGPFRAYFTAGRPYAIGNEAGDVHLAEWWLSAGVAESVVSEYFNETWTGIEHAAGSKNGL